MQPSWSEWKVYPRRGEAVGKARGVGGEREDMEL